MQSSLATCFNFCISFGFWGHFDIFDFDCFLIGSCFQDNDGYFFFWGGQGSFFSFCHLEITERHKKSSHKIKEKHLIYNSQAVLSHSNSL